MMPSEDNWDRDLPIMVVPLGFDCFMECFWGNNSPYYIPAVLDDKNDLTKSYSLWSNPTKFDKFIFGDEIIAIRRIATRRHIALSNKLYGAPDVL